MKILLVTPAPRGARNGNRVTALRWASHLRALGHRVVLDGDFTGGEWDLLIALHAHKSSGAVARFRAVLPSRPIVVGLAGTDLYQDLPRSSDALATLDGAWRIVALQPLAARTLPEHLVSRTRTILQSARAVQNVSRSDGNGEFPVCIAGNLRPVKDPFLAADAVRALPSSSPVRVFHVGGALDPEMEARARDESERNPRWRWLGERPRGETLCRIASSKLLAITSRSEGGPNVASEAIAAGVPLISTRIDGTIGLLGPDYPGYFPVGDAAAMATLLQRCAESESFLAELTDRCRAVAPALAPERERADWRALLDELAAARRLEIVDVPVAAALDLASDVEAGLSKTRKTLSCRWFYDAKGSRLFEEICEQPEYYLPRVESALLTQNAAAIVAHLPKSASLVELGSGNAHKTRILVDAMLARDGTLRYLPLDISRPALVDSSLELLADRPQLSIVAVAAEYGDGLRLLSRRRTGPQLVLWLGSNIGNFDRAQAAAFLRDVRAQLQPDDRVLIGADLKKSRAILEPAYDDAAGVTAQFNLNLLSRLNRELGAQFVVENFRHRAVFEEDQGRMAMYLVSTRAQRVPIPALDRAFDFAEGETIHTEYSYKFTLDELDAIATIAGLRLETRFLDDDRRFTLELLAPR